MTPKPPLFQLMDLKQGFIATRLLLLASQLALPARLEDGPKTCAQLALETSSHQPTLRRFLWGMAALGLVDRTADDHYGSTPLLAQLEAMLWGLEDQLYQAWQRADHTLKTGRPAWDATFGAPIYQTLDQNAALSDRFSRWNSDTAGLTAGIADRYDFARHGRVVDVGGGEGRFLSQLLHRFPKLAGVLFDRPEVVVNPVAELRGPDLVSRVEIVGGNFFESVPAGADLYCLTRVLLNWSDEKAAALLQTVRRAMAPGGRLLVIDFLLPEPDHPYYAMTILNDLNLLVNFGGMDRTEAEWEALLSGAGFKIETTQTAPPPQPYLMICMDESVG